MKLVIGLFVVIYSFQAVASSVYNFKDVSVISNAASEYEVKQDLERKAVLKVIREQIKNIVGPESYAKNIKVMNKKIIPQNRKIVTSIVEKDIHFANPTSTGKFDINLSQKTLLNLLKKNGFFATAMKKTTILPLVVIEDKVNFKNYFWWGGSSPFSAKEGRVLSLSLHKQIYKDLKKQGHKVLLPIRKKYSKAIDSNLKFASLKTVDYTKLANTFNATAVLKGKIILKKNSKTRNTYDIEYDLSLIDVENFKSLAFIKKTHKTLPGSFKASIFQGFKESKTTLVANLVQSIDENQSQGVAGSKTFLLKLKGNLKYKQYKRLKNDLKLKIGAVNSITEKEFKPGAITLELNSPSAIDGIAKRIKSSSFDKMNIQVTKENDKSLLLDVTNK